MPGYLSSSLSCVLINSTPGTSPEKGVLGSDGVDLSFASVA